MRIFICLRMPLRIKTHAQECEMIKMEEDAPVLEKDEQIVFMKDLLFEKIITVFVGKIGQEYISEDKKLFSIQDVNDVIELTIFHDVIGKSLMIEYVCDAIVFFLPSKARVNVLLDYNRSYFDKIIGQSIIKFLGVEKAENVLRLVFADYVAAEF